MKQWIAASLSPLFALAATPVMADAPAGQAYVVKSAYAHENHLWLPGRKITEQECPKGSSACAINDAHLVRFNYKSYFVVAENAAHDTVQCVGFAIAPESAEKAQSVRGQTFDMGTADPLLYKFLAPAANNDPSTLTYAFGNCIHFGAAHELEMKNAQLAFYGGGRIQGAALIPYVGFSTAFKDANDVYQSDRLDDDRLRAGPPPFGLLAPRACTGGYRDNLATAKEGDTLAASTFCP